MYFMSVNATFAVAARTRKVPRRLCTCPTTGNILILHKTLRDLCVVDMSTPSLVVDVLFVWLHWVRLGAVVGRTIHGGSHECRGGRIHTATKSTFPQSFIYVLLYALELSFNFADLTTRMFVNNRYNIIVLMRLKYKYN